jgi:hypothetical protein
VPRRKRQASTFNLSFLDIMSCGFGAVVLVFLIIDHSLEIEIQTVNAEVLSEVDLLEEDIREGEAGLVRLRNALDEADLEIVEADGLARRITEELDEYEALIAAIEESGVSDTDAIAKLQAEINQLEEKIKLLQEAAEAEAGRSAREFVGEGNRQYLTGLNLGGRRIAILVDTSASMLANQLVNVIRLRNMDPAVQKQADKWVRTLNTVDWLTAQLPVNSPIPRNLKASVPRCANAFPREAPACIMRLRRSRHYRIRPTIFFCSPTDCRHRAPTRPEVARSAVTIA